LLHLSARINFQLFHLVLTLAFIAAATFVCYRVIQVNPHHRGIRLPAVRAGRRHGLGVGRSVCRLRSRDVGVQFFLLPPLETFTIADLPNPSRAKSAVAAMRVNVLRLNLALDQSYPLTK
jgi:hypothetical protein